MKKGRKYIMLNLFISRTTAAIKGGIGGKSHWASESFFHIIWADISQYSKREGRLCFPTQLRYLLHSSHSIISEKIIFLFFFWVRIASVGAAGEFLHTNFRASSEKNFRIVTYPKLDILKINTTIWNFHSAGAALSDQIILYSDYYIYDMIVCIIRAKKNGRSKDTVILVSQNIR